MNQLSEMVLFDKQYELFCSCNDNRGMYTYIAARVEVCIQDVASKTSQCVPYLGVVTSYGVA